jgi:hypothetical protein
MSGSMEGKEAPQLGQLVSLASLVWPHCSQRIAVAAVVLEIAVLSDLGETFQEFYALAARCRVAPCSVT